MGVVGNILVRLGLETAEFDNRVKSAGDRMAGFGNRMKAETESAFSFEKLTVGGLKLAVWSQAIKGVSEVTAGAAAAIRGDWQGVDAALQKLPLGVGEAYRSIKDAWVSISETITGEAEKAQKAAERLAQSKALDDYIQKVTAIADKAKETTLALQTSGFDTERRQAQREAQQARDAVQKEFDDYAQKTGLDTTGEAAKKKNAAFAEIDKAEKVKLTDIDKRQQQAALDAIKEQSYKDNEQLNKRIIDEANRAEKQRNAVRDIQRQTTDAKIAGIQDADERERQALAESQRRRLEDAKGQTDQYKMELAKLSKAESEALAKRQSDKAQAERNAIAQTALEGVQKGYVQTASWIEQHLSPEDQMKLKREEFISSLGSNYKQHKDTWDQWADMMFANPKARGGDFFGLSGRWESIQSQLSKADDTPKMTLETMKQMRDAIDKLNAQGLALKGR